jgi:hypothetical protein
MEDIVRSLEARKENLIFLLKNKKEFLELEKQHQIYGAIKEIDYILRMISYSKEEQEPEQQIVMNNDGKESVVKKIGERVRSFKAPIRIKFSKDEE